MVGESVVDELARPARALQALPTRMSWRYPLVELSVGAIWGLLAWRLMDLIVNTRYGFALPYLNLEYTAGIMIFC